MAKIQIQTVRPFSRRQRFFWWFGRHKILTVFLVLVLGLSLYVFEGWVSTQLQVRAERKRFVAADQTLSVLEKLVPDTNSPTVKHYRECSYTSDGAVFGNRYLGCGMGFNIAYTGISETDAQNVTDSVRTVMSRSGITLTKNEGAYDANDLAVYVFELQGIKCALSSTYYDASTPSSSRDVSAPDTGTVDFMDIGCGGSAKAEYFPVVTD
ncbi:MAG TPA: hypothetical protein VLF40_06085 [Candidatus Saccharimonadales bacterium]|nr:hypothetical protein [Candidatus Saccharimonadales bacterium]